MPRFALVLMSMLLALTLGCSPQPPAKPATPAASKAPAQAAKPAAPSIGDANPLDRPATPRPIGATPSSPDRSCRTDADCTVKNVGNCCGYYPACVNVNAKTDPKAVQAQCAKSGQVGVCGFPEISSCQCVKGQCAADPRGNML